MLPDGFRLETERLVLRPYRVEDLDALAAILGDPETMQHYPEPFTRAQARGWIEDNIARYERDGFGLWAIDSKESGEFLGNCGLAVPVVEGAPE
nr:GNAT family N-acetyltransferase [Actinomycetota bacterium]